MVRSVGLLVVLCLSIDAVTDVGEEVAEELRCLVRRMEGILDHLGVGVAALAVLLPLSSPSE